MGTEYAIVSDAAGEGYELGKGPWFAMEPAIRAGKDALAQAFAGAFPDADDSYAGVVAAEVVAFATAHPDWRILDDVRNDWSWHGDEGPPASAHYRRVGSRYRYRGAILVNPYIPDGDGKWYG